MGVSAKKRAQLSAFLSGLPNGAALKLFAALEHGQASDRNDLPYTDILSQLRARLLERKAPFPNRRVNARRMFFAPFEDFFIADHGARKRPFEIARTSLMSIWTFLTTDPRFAGAASHAKDLDAALVADPVSAQDVERLTRDLHAAMATALKSFCEDINRNSEDKSRAVSILGDANTLTDLVDLQRLSGETATFRKFHDVVAADTSHLQEGHLYQLRQLFLEASERNAGAYLLLALKGRLAKPWSAIGAYYHLANGADPALVRARDAIDILPASLCEDIESMARAMERDGAQSFDGAAAQLRIAYFTDYTDGLATHARRAGDNVLLNRIEACREVAGEAYERFCEQALAQLRQATPVRKAHVSSKLMSLRPDTAFAVSRDDVKRARECAAFLADCPEMIGRLGAERSQLTVIVDQARERLETYANDLVVEIRAAEGDERDAARRSLDNILNVADPLVNCDTLGLIRDRASAAALAV